MRSGPFHHQTYCLRWQVAKQYAQVIYCYNGLEIIVDYVEVGGVMIVVVHLDYHAIEAA